jgi:acyl carrier protein
MYGELNMGTREANVEKIISVLHEEYGLDKDIQLTPQTSISRLDIDTDDLSFLIIPALHKAFGRELSVAIWSKIETIEEIADAFERKSIQE